MIVRDVAQLRSVQHSLGVNLGSAMLLVDYAAHGFATPTPWAQAAATRLSRAGRERLELLRAVLAHGWVLRSWLLQRLPASHPAHRSWEELRRWLANQTAPEIEGLVTGGIRSGLLWGAPAGAAAAVDEALADPIRRAEGLRTVLQIWRIEPVHDALSLALDPFRFHAELLALLDELWERWLRQAWQTAEPELKAAAAAITETLPSLAGLDAEALVSRLTGLEPTEAWVDPLRSAEELIFVPSLFMGRYLSIAREEGQVLLLFEPASLRQAVASPVPGLHLTDLADLGHALEGLGEPTRLTILNLLAARGELCGQEIVELVDVHQSTVSRNLALLERTRLVHVRREGNMKRYSLNQERIHQVCRLLAGALG
ncbi:MAG: ArsR/SmtB family transcription factor [Bacillota bacterium]